LQHAARYDWLGYERTSTTTVVNFGKRVTGAMPVSKYKIEALGAFPIDQGRRAPKTLIDASAGRMRKPPGAIARLGGTWR
jgi:hypothetical protein